MDAYRARAPPCARLVSPNLVTCHARRCRDVTHFLLVRLSPLCVSGRAERAAMKNRFLRFPDLYSALALAPIFAMPAFASAATVANPLCPDNTAIFNPDSGKDIVVPPGFTVSVFKAGINFPTGIAFRGNKQKFEVYVLESGHGLPSRCNEQSNFGSGDFDATNPFTPDILVFDSNGKLLRTLGKPTASGGFQTAGPAVDIGFERGIQGGRLFATDSNQATHAQGQNNSSRIVIVDPDTGKVTPFISQLPTGDHPRVSCWRTRARRECLRDCHSPTRRRRCALAPRSLSARTQARCPRRGAV